MTNQERVKTALAKPTETKTLKDMIRGAAMELGKALPAHLNPERVCRIALTSISLNPELAKCTPASFMGSLFVLAQIGLEPIAGRAYLLPFKNSKKVGDQWITVPEVQAIIGYKGLIELFYRHDSALSIDMQTVYENDEFSYEYGTNSYLKHRPANKDRGQAIGYYAVARLKGGAGLFRYMSKDEAMDHGRKHSKTWDKKSEKFYDASPWAKEPDTMCMKTVLIQLAKLLPLSVELQRALTVDETSRDYRSGVGDALDMPTTTAWGAEEPANGQIVDSTPAKPHTAAIPEADAKDPIQVEFAKMKAKVGKEKYYRILGENGFEHSTEIRDGQTAQKIMKLMMEGG